MAEKNLDRQRHIVIFTRESCPKCSAAKRFVEGYAGDNWTHLIDSISVSAVDSDSSALAEMAYINAMSTPTIAIFDGHRQALAAWRGEIPTHIEFQKYLTR